MLEKTIEKKIKDYAKSKECLAYKFTSPARRSVPDGMFITPLGTVFFIELKQLGKKPTPGQEREIKRLQEQYVSVFIVDNVETGKQIIDDMVAL